MSLRLLPLLCATALAAAGCGASEDYVDAPVGLDEWIGASERELVLKLGAPDAVYEMKGGGRILTWRRSDTERQGGDVYTVTETHMVDGQKVMVPVTRQAPVITWKANCVASFEVDADGYVVGHTAQGNDCGALPLPDM